MTCLRMNFTLTCLLPADCLPCLWCLRPARFSLAAIAVAREGSETVVFLSSLAMGSNGFASGQFWLALGLGVVSGSCGVLA